MAAAPAKSYRFAGGFLAAYAMQGLYGGSMVHVDGTEKTAFGINVGVTGFGWVFVSSVFTLVRAGRQDTAC